MTTSRKKLLTFQEVTTLGHATQAGIFSGIFGAVEWVTTSWGKFLFFPAATFFSILNFGFQVNTYFNERNKSLGKTASLSLTMGSLVAESVAVTAALTGALFSGALVPVIFFGMIVTNFLYHLMQTGYHGYKWLTSENESHARKQHRKAFGNHLVTTVVLGAVGTAIGLLLMSPAQGILTLTATAVIAVKASTIPVLILNACKVAFYDFPLMRKKRKDREMIELIKQQDLVPAVTIHLGDNFEKPKKNNEYKLTDSKLTDSKLTDFKLTDSYLVTPAIRNRIGINEKSLEKEITLDLIEKIKSNPAKGYENPAKGHEKEIVLDFLSDAKKSLLADYNNNNGWFIECQRTKRFNKLKVIGWLIDLVANNKVCVGDKWGTPVYVYNFNELKPHIKNLGSDVFSSLFATKINGGKVEKLYDVVEYYMANKNTFEKSEPLMDKSNNEIMAFGL